jgi:Lar family restriction alleviation protein
MPSDKLELKSCPFCGSEKVFIGESYGNYYVECVICSATGSTDGKTEIEAAKLWNKRHA